MERKDNYFSTSAIDMNNVWYGSHGIKYSDEFRQVVYKINPVYLSCMYKSMFETNATNKLRHLEESFADDDDQAASTTEDNRESSNDEYDDTDMMGRVCMEQKRLSRSLSKLNNSNATGSNIIRSCSMPSRLPTDQKIFSKQFTQGIYGWKVCARPHSAHCSGYQRHTIAETRELHRNRSRSANNCRREKSKILKIQNLVYRPSAEVSQTKDFQRESIGTNVKEKREDISAQNSTSSITGSYFSTAGYTTTYPPIKYKFKHFDYSKNYIEQYRDEYTYRKLTTQKSNTTGPCHCEVRVPNTCIPVMPMMPLFRWVETSAVSKPYRDEHMRNGKEDGRPPSCTPVKTVINKRSPNSQGPDMSRQSAHYLLSHNGILRMEYYNNPLTVDNSCPNERLPIVCRSRPSIPSNAHGNLHPSSTDSNCRTVYHRKGIP